MNKPPYLKLVITGRREGYDSPLGAPPAELSDAAAKVWNRVAPELDPLELDRDTLVAYCTAVARMRKAENEVNRGGLEIPDASGNLVKNPALTVLEEVERSVSALAQELGIAS
jgi:P27 family predicted phage terminase small subunit